MTFSSPQRVDKDGLPIPAAFDEESTGKPAQAGAVRWFRLGLVLFGLVLVTGVLVRSKGKDWVADWYTARAYQRYLNEDLPGALADLDQALSWRPDAPELLVQRALYRAAAQNLDGSLEDYNQLLEKSPTYARGFAGRSVVYQRLERHAEAIADLNKAIELRPSNDHQLLNQRAYTRAIAGLELEAALTDIERALELADEPVAAYLDTRGYVRFRLGQLDMALVDLDQALKQSAEERKVWLKTAADNSYTQPRRNKLLRTLDENDAVMYHHRGQVHEQLGHAEQAAADLKRGQELGYNPAQGVF